LDLTEIPQKIQDILLPLMNELVDQNETLTLEEFVMASKHLYVSLPIQFKQYLMEWYSSLSKNKINSNKQAIRNFSFKVYNNIIIYILFFKYILIYFI
jgi:hypothetical protein